MNQSTEPDTEEGRKAPAYDLPRGSQTSDPPPPTVTRTKLPDGTVLEREVLTNGTMIEQRVNP